ncbi:MAG: Na+/H+ antiporter NhaA [Sphingomonas sanxanigenens]|uniref:Na(+)/H(+) antiporter NhaA n=1 Tax=Sphingomonas sanxanigenens TaxID=397260 RepID=A0A2W5ABA2_9SPHN|nr:MAG: Na+/H+ antiporter NhaA [Sphingomonas sanxanigenens]
MAKTGGGPARQRGYATLLDFLATEAGAGILLILSALAALIAANIPGVAEDYFSLLHIETGPVLADKIGPMTVHLWINDGLMALFFLLVGLEIKREFIDGELARWSDRVLPMVAAGAGMLMPAIVFLLATRGQSDLAAGWAIPAATDIAFAIGVLALLGSRAPAALKLFLTTVAIVDDMGAVAIIAIAYTKGLNLAALGLAALVLVCMMLMNRAGVRSLIPYLAGFLLLWLAILSSGVHATIAGVLAALTIPISGTSDAPDAKDSPLHELEHGLHPLVAFVIVPLFGFANAGVSFAGMGADAVFAPLPLGIALGLFLGKQIGIFGAVRLAVAAGLAERPGNAGWGQIYGIALLCGIGFTMSLFIGGLAFSDPLLADEVKIGVLGGSLISAIAGFALLRFLPADRK